MPRVMNMLTQKATGRNFAHLFHTSSKILWFLFFTALAYTQ